MNSFKHEQGYSLIEVIAAIVIIGIVLLGFSQMFIQSNKIAHKNNEKLATVNLADAMLERLKSESFSQDASITNLNDYFVDNSEPNRAKKNPPTLIQMNGKDYEVTYAASQNRNVVQNATYSEVQLKLIKVVVTVMAPDGKTKGSSEGYVSLE
jgi:prepilin-type N-terminal cleavage/methylation domain-containing protein